MKTSGSVTKTNDDSVVFTDYFAEPIPKAACGGTERGLSEC